MAHCDVFTFCAAAETAAAAANLQLRPGGSHAPPRVPIDAAGALGD